ncbi:putative transposase [Neisseria meningitidis]|nr:putative transposase [Neisseria meningitidis]
MFDGEVEADESYFGGQRKGKRGRGAAGKVAVFGLLKRNGKVYTDCYRSYDVLDVREFSHFSFAETSFSYQSQHTFC